MSSQAKLAEINLTPTNQPKLTVVQKSEDFKESKSNYEVTHNFLESFGIKEDRSSFFDGLGAF